MTTSITTGTISDVEAMRRIDIAEARLLKLGAKRATSPGGTIDACPVKHHFTPGLYCREIFMPRGMIVVSKIHRLRHPFVISAGECLVYLGGETWQHLKAPHFGITEPGTRRLLFIIQDTVWTTFHVTDKTDVDEIATDILIEYENPLLKEVA